MLYQYRSNRIEWLARRLSDSLTAQEFPHPLYRQRIIVPNRDNARWLQFQLASLNSITANVHYQLPAEWMWSEIRMLHPGLPEKLASDLNPMKWAVMEMLSENKTPETAAILRNYLDVPDEENRIIRCWQMSGLIASVFDKYMVHRPDMITAWEYDRKTTQNSHEVWQKDLWKNLKNYWNTYYDDVTGYSRTDLQKELLQKVESGEADRNAGTPLYIFHPGKLPGPVTGVIAAYSKHLPVYLFTCRLIDSFKNELTDDVYLEEMLKEEISADQLWHPLISDDTRSKVESHFKREEEDTFLKSVQNSILSGKAQNKKAEPDHSLRIHSCHSPLREMETLQEFLLECFEESDDLRPDDIAVVSPVIDTYAPFIHAVFGNSDGSVPRIPYSIAGSGHGQTDMLSGVFKKLLEMIDSRWQATDVVEILHNKPVMQKFELDESDVIEIRDWIVKNNVTWGIDLAHRKEFQQPENKSNTFQAALDRLWTGSIFDLNDFQFVNETPAWHGLDSSDSNELLGRFSAFIHTMKQIYLQTHSENTVSEWCEKAMNWIDALFPSVSHDYRYYELAESILSISEEGKISGFQGRIPFEIFKNRLISKIETGFSSSVSFTGGILFSPMVPLRNIPFKVVAMVGLNEENFPRNITSPEFDLIQNSPLPYETTAKDEDRHLFIQYVMAAGRKLLISYIGRSAEDNEKIPPSVILEKWMDIVQERTGVSKKLLISEKSLHGFTGKALDMEMSRSETYSMVASSAVENTGKSGFYITNKKTEPVAKKEVTVSDLETFYRHPLKYYLQKNIGAYLSDFDDRLGKEYFSDDALLNYKLAGPALNWLEYGIAPEAIKKLFTNSGSVPEGLPGEMIADSVLHNSQNVLQALQDKSGSDKKSSIDINKSLNGIELQGKIDTFSENGYVDLFLSSKNGKNLVTAWIRYLVLLLMKDTGRIENHILFNAKKDEGNWVSFKEVGDAASVLANLLQIYLDGQHQPFLFAPDTAFTFAEANSGDDINKAVRKAETKWFGSQYVFAENDDPVYSLWFGRQNPLERSEFIDNAQRVFNDLIFHIE